MIEIKSKETGELLATLDTSSLAGSTVSGSGRNYRKFNFRVKSNANQERQIEITVNKLSDGIWSITVPSFIADTLNCLSFMMISI